MILMGCTPGQSGEGPEVGSIVPIGQPEIRDLSPTTETVPNCSGGNTTITKHPSMTVATSYAIEWEIGGEVGVGVTIGEGVVPGGVNLEGALNGATSNGLDSGIEQSSAWDLPAEPNTIREYTIMWREVWQPGYVNIILPTGENMQVNVAYRSGIQSDIIGDKLLNCDGSQDSEGSPPDNEPLPTPTTSKRTGGNSSNCIASEQGLLAQTDHFFSGPVHVIQLWRQNGNTDWGSDELMAVVVGDVNIVAAGGNVWTYPSAACESVARIHMQDGANQRDSIVLTEEQMREAGLIK